MANTRKRACLYSASQIGEILKIARERSCQEERRTKRFMAKELCITEQRLTNIENGFSQPTFEIAADWCRISQDYVALAKIKHIYRMGLPPTDPRIQNSVPDQLTNLKKQAKGAIMAAESLLEISTDMRPGRTLTDRIVADIIKMAEEILDMKQAAESTLQAMVKNWHLNIEEVERNWIQEALADQVIIPSVTAYEVIRKEEFFEQRARSFGRLEH